MENIVITEQPVKVKRPRGRPIKPDKLTPAERQKEYMKDPEFKEKHRLRCKAYNDKMKKMRDFCRSQNVEL
jgi:hypothetical protein